MNNRIAMSDNQLETCRKAALPRRGADSLTQGPRRETPPPEITYNKVNTVESQ